MLEKVGEDQLVRSFDKRELLRTRRSKEERNILHRVKRTKANRIGRILLRNCLVRQVIEGEVEGRIEGMGRRGTRGKHLLDDLKETRDYWSMKGGSIRSHFMENSLWKGR